MGDWGTVDYTTSKRYNCPMDTRDLFTNKNTPLTLVSTFIGGVFLFRKALWK